jgi:hypothetical protein
MPMPMLDAQKHIELRKVTECQTCGAPSRYIYKEKVWCRTCLDNEQWPHLAHLTQEERDQRRRNFASGERQNNIINAGNLKIGFGK